jgi:tRNA A-37 threonylcarbamoyl transferase component Bud32
MHILGASATPGLPRDGALGPSNSTFGRLERPEIVRVVADLLCADAASIQIDSEARRLYSSTFTVTVRSQGTVRRYFVKQAPASLRRQHEMLVKANAAICLPFFKRLQSVYDARFNLLVMEYFEGVTLKQRLTKLPNTSPAIARSSLAKDFERIGAWLRALHQIEISDGDLMTRCKAYLGKRMADIRTAVDCDFLMRLTDDLHLRPARLALSHGDFTPENILLDDKGMLAAVDYGISEWQHMAPSWDLVSFDVGCERIFKETQLRQVMAWLLGAKWLRAAFCRGYGGASDSDPAHELCCVLRHVSYLAGHMKGGTGNSAAARRHRRALERSLDRLAAMLA